RSPPSDWIAGRISSSTRRTRSSTPGPPPPTPPTPVPTALVSPSAAISDAPREALAAGTGALGASGSEVREVSANVVCPDKRSNQRSGHIIRAGEGPYHPRGPVRRRGEPPRGGEGGGRWGEGTRRDKI